MPSEFESAYYVKNHIQLCSETWDQVRWPALLIELLEASLERVPHPCALCKVGISNLCPLVI